MYNIRAPSLKIFSKWTISQIRHCKNFRCRLSKFSLHSLTASWSKASRLSPTVQLDFSWTLEISDRQNDRFVRQSESLRQFVECHVYYLSTPSQKLFWKSLKFKTKHCKNFKCPLSKVSLQCQTVIDQRLTIFHQLFGWTSAGPFHWQNDRFARPSESLSHSLNAMCTIWELLHKKVFECH